MSIHEHELSEFERRLAALRPRPSRIDRDRLFFRAGRESALRDAGGTVHTASADADAARVETDRHRLRRQIRVWQTTTVLATLVSLSLGMALFYPSRPAAVTDRSAKPTAHHDQPQQLPHKVDTAPRLEPRDPVVATEAYRRPTRRRTDAGLDLLERWGVGLGRTNESAWTMRQLLLARDFDALPESRPTVSADASGSDQSYRNPPRLSREALLEELLGPQANAPGRLAGSPAGGFLEKLFFRPTKETL